MYLLGSITNYVFTCLTYCLVGLCLAGTPLTINSQMARCWEEDCWHCVTTCIFAHFFLTRPAWIRYDISYIPCTRVWCRDDMCRCATCRSCQLLSSKLRCRRTWNGMMQTFPSSLRSGKTTWPQFKPGLALHMHKHLEHWEAWTARYQTRQLALGCARFSSGVDISRNPVRPALPWPR